MPYWFIIQNDQLIVEKNQKDFIPFLDDSRVEKIKPFFLRNHSIGQLNNQTLFSAELLETQILPDHLQAISLRSAISLYKSEWYHLAAKAYAIIQWDKNHAFCGRCGNNTQQTKELYERVCKTCALTFYPRISPSIIVLIQKGDTILMARGPYFSPGVYALIAGFVEPGESIEEAIHREVKEEVGIQIKNLTYFGSQSWPLPDSLMIGFIADYASGELKIDPREIEEAGWYRHDKLPGRPTFSISIASKMIDYFVDLKKKGIKNVCY